MSDQQISRMGMPVDSLAIPHFTEVQEPQLVALVCSGRAGTKILQSFLDDHKNILMIPGYPLLYLYPHWATWQEQFSRDLSWERVIDLFCEKHASVLDSRRVAGLSGLERLGPQRDQHIEIDEQLFRNSLKIMLAGLPVSRRTFNLAVHYAYGICRRWDLNSDFILIYHLHDSSYLKEVSEDFPDLKVLNMIRNPGPSLHSTRRSLGIVDREKLNLTDSLRCIGRNFRFDCHLQFDFLDEMASYLSSDQVVSLRQESLHEHHEGSMKSLADWLGVEFSDSMLQSTFDGKAWWGDVTNETPVSGLDPAAMSDKWRGSISNTDSFVIEGISFQFFKRYNYKLTKYRHDSALNRLLLLCAVLLPSKAEWQTIGTYLDPRTHMRLVTCGL